VTDQATRVVPAGWYEDPSDTTQVRWWNGIAWTDHTQPKPEISAAEESAELEERFAEPAAVRSRNRIRSTSTAESWLLAFSPILFIAAVVAIVWVDLYYVQSPLLWLLMLVPYGLGVLWGVLDVRKLRRWGHTPPAAFWAFLTPLVYLIVRRMKVTGWGQLATLLGILVVAGGLYAAVWATGAARPLELAVTIQTEIRDDLVGSGQASLVACPPIADTMTVGAIYVCDTTLPDGSHGSVWVSIDSDEGDFSYALSLH